MKNLLTIIAAILSLTAFSENWQNISTPKDINEILTKNEKTYLATSGGLLIYNNTTKNIERIFKEDGIGSNLVEDVDFDNQGNIWIGTYDNGVSKFNGSNWINFPIPEDLFFNPTLLYSIAVDKNNKVWAATSNGIISLVNNVWEINSSQTVWSLSKGNNNVIFYAGHFPGKIEGDSLTEFSDCPIFSYSDAVGEVVQNKYYYSSHGRLVSYENGVWDSLSISIPNDIIDISSNNNNELFFHIRDEGLYSLKNGLFQEESASQTIVPTYKGQVEIVDNKLFYGLDASLYVLDGLTNENIDLKHKNLSSNYYNNLFTVGEKVLVKNQGSNLITFDPLNLNTVNQNPIPNITDYTNWQINVSKYDGSIYYLNILTGEIFLNENMLQAWDTAILNFTASYQVRAVLLDSKNTLWLATNDGLQEINDGNITTHNTITATFTEDQVWAVAEDNEGNIWSGTSKEICKFDGTNWIEHHDAQANNWAFGGAVSNFYFDKKNILYCTSWANGLTKYDGTNWSVFQVQNSDLPSNNVNYIYATDDLMYLATNKGLSIFDGTSFENFDRDNSGLMDNYCNLITKDHLGNIWVVSNQGINIYNKNGIENSIISNNNEEKLKVYPNPSSEIINILSEKQIEKIEIFNVLGVKVYYKNGTNKYLETVETNNLEKGIYFIYLYNHSKVTKASFIKN